MISKKTIVTGLFLAGSMALSSMPAEAQDGILFRERAGDSNYCHLKFPAMQEDTLTWDNPRLKPAGTGDIIDFYGSCNYNPTGEQAVEAQKQARQRQFWRDQAS